MARFQSTRPVRGATLLVHMTGIGRPISIHAPRAGRDSLPGFPGRRYGHFNPRAPCGARHRDGPPAAGPSDFNPRAPCGARLQRNDAHHERCVFQSTRPVRGATAINSKAREICSNFNPRAPCGARRRFIQRFHGATNFNPRAPCGARPSPWSSHKEWQDFNPRAPCGARLWP